jgi:single-strand DNA-binding protein
MASVNKWLGIGNLGADPETRYLPNGDQTTTIRIACTESWKDKQTGERKESTEWVRVVFWRKLAEIAGQYLKKGSQVYVEGALKTRKWVDKDGTERYTTEVVADQMVMLGGRNGQRTEQSDGNSASTPAQGRAPSGSSQGAGPVTGLEDDIPFAPLRGWGM